jgi:hypothetical protein
MLANNPTQPHRRRHSARGPPLPRRRVSFGAVEVRIYERVLGDSPCNGGGPLLSLGWCYANEEPQHVELLRVTTGKSSL